MELKNNEIRLLDLIDIDFLQESQGIFTRALDVGIVIVDENGPITTPTNFSDVCVKFHRRTSEGVKRCSECGIKHSKKAGLKVQAQLYTCPCGLLAFAAPIVAGNKQYGALIGGHILCEPLSEEEMAKMIGDSNYSEAEYKKALEEIRIIPKPFLENTAEILSRYASSLSKIAQVNLNELNKLNKENVFSLVLEAMTEISDNRSKKEKIVSIIGNFVGADRCFLYEYDKTSSKFLCLDHEYKSDVEMSSCLGFCLSDHLPSFAEKVFQGETIYLTPENKKYFESVVESKTEKERMESRNVSAAAVFPIRYNDEYFGALAIFYLDNDDFVTRNQIKIIRILVKQIAIFLKLIKTSD